MSDTTNFVNGKVLEERLAALDRRVEDIEKSLESQRKEFVDLLVELRVLSTRVSLYAAAISLGVGLLQRFVH